MTVPARPTPAPRAAPIRHAPRPAPPPPARPGRDWRLLLAGCLVLAAVSLLWPSEPTYDPRAWLVWGREIAHGTLHTVGGPSWKPLPALFTAPFSLAGDAAAAPLWLVVARAGGLLGIVMAHRVATRLAGPPAGAIAAVAVLAAGGYWFNAWRGNSEGLLAGLTLWAVDRHLDGRRTWAFMLGFAAALVRPELWLLWAAYGLWLAVREPPRRPWVAACLMAVPLAWLVPEQIGSGDFLRAAARAREPNLGSPAYADFPAYAVLRASLQGLAPVVAAGAVAAVVVAVRRRGGHDRVTLRLGAGAATLLVVVALMTEGGFSGNPRYVLLPMVLLCVLAGAGWAELVRAARRRAGVLTAVVVAAGLAGGAQAAGGAVRDLRVEWIQMTREAANVRDLPALMRRAGGRRAFLRCGRVHTTRFEVPVVAWTLGLRLQDVDTAAAPGTVVAIKGSARSRQARLRPFAASSRWIAVRRC